MYSSLAGRGCITTEKRRSISDAKRRNTFLLNEQILLANNYSRFPIFLAIQRGWPDRSSNRYLKRLVACARILFKSAIVHRRNRRSIGVKEKWTRSRQPEREGWKKRVSGSTIRFQSSEIKLHPRNSTIARMFRTSVSQDIEGISHS